MNSLNFYGYVLAIFLLQVNLFGVERVDINSSAIQSNNESSFAATSVDGRYVVFASYFDNLVPGFKTTAKGNSFGAQRASF
jgi:hypothetical protein